MIHAEKLNMHYGPIKALNDVSFTVNEGEIVALLGPNGAGKSTTMKILTTYLHPTAGHASIAGYDILEHPLQARSHIGYLPENLPLYMDTEVKSYLKFVGEARGLRSTKLKERIEKVVEECALTPMYRKPIRELSKGYKQRTGLAQALIHDPSVVILDEPTSGLDPHQILEIRALIRRLAQGKTVLLSTHILQEVEASADRVVIINRGDLIADGTPKELKAQASDCDRVRIGIKGNSKSIERVLSGVSGVSKVQTLDEDKGYAHFTIFGKTNSKLWKSLSQTARDQQWELKELVNEPLSLEETFLALTDKVGKGGVS
jgi:ABC-2 type transport system ATP-binding protein